MTGLSTVLPVSPPQPAAPPGQSWPIETLWQAGRPSGTAARGGTVPADLASRFSGRLEFPLRDDRPTIVANFVSTLDGVVALDRSGATGGREISGGFEPDRFLMGLLRATADAVVVGAGTVRASRSKDWTPGSVHPASAAGYAAWRRQLGLAGEPTTVIVSGSGDLDLDQLRGDGAHVIVVTTPGGARRLHGDHGTGQGRDQDTPRVEVVPVAGDSRIRIDGLLALLGDRGFRLVLSEAGPTVFGALLDARAVDELFLTVAPRIAGRGPGTGRLSLVEGIGLPSSHASSGRLQGVMRAADHLFLRYDLRPQGKEAS